MDGEERKEKEEAACLHRVSVFLVKGLSRTRSGKREKAWRGGGDMVEEGGAWVASGEESARSPTRSPVKFRAKGSRCSTSVEAGSPGSRPRRTS